MSNRVEHIAVTIPIVVGFFFVGILLGWNKGYEAGRLTGRAEAVLLNMPGFTVEHNGKEYNGEE